MATLARVFVDDTFASRIARRMSSVVGYDANVACLYTRSIIDRWPSRRRSRHVTQSFPATRLFHDISYLRDVTSRCFWNIINNGVKIHLREESRIDMS